ncbi:MAG: hypothetical protein KF893_06395 [Caldilineaceae bacterium]|nr:hypothetical protein [Caldilineaceae bacterium]
MTVPTRFGILRLISTLLKTMAWIILVLSILGAFMVGLFGPMLGEALLDPALVALLAFDSAAGIVAGITLLIFGVVTFLSLFAAAESIQVQLAIEENTRLTAALLLRMDEESRPVEADPPYTYYGEVVDE